MKKLSDYKGDEAMLLWADLLDLFITIFGDKEIGLLVRAKKAPLLTAKKILEKYPKEAGDILLRIDPEPLTGLNIVTRLAGLINEIGNDPDIRSFFGSQPEVNKEETSTGSATENTEVGENQNISSNM